MGKYLIQSWIKRTADQGLTQDGISVHRTKKALKEYIEEQETKDRTGMSHGSPITVSLEDDLFEGPSLRLNRAAGMKFMKKHKLDNL